MRTTERLGQAFRDTSASYKFFWFLGLLDSLPKLGGPVDFSTLARAMVIRAWPVVAFYRLSLGSIDRLQACVRDLQSASGLAGRATPHELGAAIDRWDEFENWSQELTRFVPGRFLSPWFPTLARQRPYDRRGARDVAIASNQQWGTETAGPYRLYSLDGREMLELDGDWRLWLSQHHALVQGFAEQALCRFLQARNPGVPGIVAKLQAPRRRSLAHARAFWATMIDRARAQGAPFRDIYSGAVLGSQIDIDHFLPWAFMVHDEIWNLIPVTPRINRSKRDHIPDLERYLDPFIGHHQRAIALLAQREPAPAAYLEFFACDKQSLVRRPALEIHRRFDEVFRPLAQIAINQGFPGAWRLEVEGSCGELPF